MLGDMAPHNEAEVTARNLRVAAWMERRADEILAVRRCDAVGHGLRARAKQLRAEAAVRS
jgi:hypothetical protein